MAADLGVIIYIRDITISSSGKTVYAAGPKGACCVLGRMQKKWGPFGPGDTIKQQ